MPSSQLNIWADDDTRRRLIILARQWSPIKPLTISVTVRECVRRIFETDVPASAQKILLEEVIPPGRARR
jgi:hypothetical protein